MEQKHHFIISRYCPKEEIFDGMMTFTEARRFMDENATFERRVGFQVFNDRTNKWEKFDDSYHGGRKVYDKGVLYVIDPDYRNMWKWEGERWYIWDTSNGQRNFMSSHATEERAKNVCERLQSWSDDMESGRQYIIEQSNINPSRL